MLCYLREIHFLCRLFINLFIYLSFYLFLSFLLFFCLSFSLLSSTCSPLLSSILILTYFELTPSYHISHCRARTQMYHTLLHYKARLFLKIGYVVLIALSCTDLSCPVLSCPAPTLACFFLLVLVECSMTVVKSGLPICPSKIPSVPILRC